MQTNGTYQIAHEDGVHGVWELRVVLTAMLSLHTTSLQHHVFHRSGGLAAARQLAIIETMRNASIVVLAIAL